MKKLNIFLILLLSVMVVISFAACGNVADENKSGEASASKYPLTIKDDLGNEVIIESEPEKIVSVAPSNTEIIFALEQGEKLVGRSEYCNYPEEAMDIEIVGGFSGPNTELILELEPDVVFAAGSVPEEAKTLLEGSGIKVIVFNPENIDGVLDNIILTGEILNVSDSATDLVEGLKEKRQEIVEKVAGEESKRVFIDLGGFVSAGSGSFIDSILLELGAENVASAGDGQWPTLTLEQVVDADPEVYISLYPSLEELNEIAGLNEISAFKNEQAVVIPWGIEENDVVQRPGPRIIDGLEVYAKTIYPLVFK